MKMINPSMLLLSMVLLTVACKRQGENIPGYGENYDNTTILKWNEAASVAVSRTGDVPPMTESRLFAMVNVAMHDAINNIVKKYGTYAFSAPADHTADPHAATAQAAHDVLVRVLPPQQAFADSLLDVCLKAIAPGRAKEKGISLGKSAAAAMLTKRGNDGASTAQYPIMQGTLPGQYQSTPPFSANGFALFPGWGKVEPFSLNRSNQFRPGSPYEINSTQYTSDFNEIKTMGGAASSNRTPDQTQLGIFWLENVPASWNRITRTLIGQSNLDGYNTAYLLAILNMAEADANIAVFEAKYFYNFWRPVTAVRLAGADGNPHTEGDAEWNILGKVTPPVPDYPSNHAADGGAAAEILTLYFGKDDFAFTTSSPTMPGTTRRFTSLSQAATEVSLSRIYVGYHFRYAVVAGEDMGRKIGRWVFENSLLPVK